MIRNQSWYNQNAGRGYPLADTASQLSDSGERLPSDIITDINLRYPSTLGNYPFVSSVAVSGRLVSVTLQVASSMDDGGFTPLAAVSVLVADLVPGRQYPLEAQHPGVGGWITFGDKHELFAGRFSGPSQTLLVPQAARPYRPLPVTGMKKLYADTLLTGVVTIKGIAPVQVVAEGREIEGVLRDVVVVRLVQDDSNVDGHELNVFETFAGPCGKRPESGNCGHPEPVQFINTIPPDCNGNITIELRGCARIAEVLGTCGVVIDCGLGLSEACLPDTLPAADGTLRTDYPDLCASDSSQESDGSETSESLPPDGGGGGGESAGSESSVSMGSLPYTETFDDQAADDWDTVGSFTFEADDAPDQPGGGSGYSLATATTAAAAARNLAVWAGFDMESIGRRYQTTLKMRVGPSDAQHNGGLVFNYKPHPTLLGRYTWYLAEIDYDEMVFRVRRFNGTTLIPLVSASVPGLALDAWFNITVDVVDGGGTSGSITATLTGVTNPAVSATIGPLLSSAYQPATGDAGVHVNRGYTRFGYFHVEEI